MYDPEAYTKVNLLTVKYSEECLQEVKHLFKWEENETVLDVGSGDGKVTLKLLFPFLPKNINQLIAVDLSDAMIEYAKQHFNYPKINYVKLDITGDMPEDFKEKFQHIFSFFALNMVQNQRKLFQNLYEVLKPGGQMMLPFLLNSPFLNTTLNICQNPKWSRYINNFDTGMYPYNGVEKSETLLQNLLISQGFNILYFKKETEIFQSSTANLEKLGLSCFSYIKNIPKNKIEAFNKDYKTTLRAQDMIEFREDIAILQFDFVKVFVTKS